MKRFFALLFLVTGLALNAQVVFKDYLDGVVYVKLSKETGRALLKLPPRNIPLRSVTALSDVLEEYQVTKITRPFFTASDDEVLPYILRVQFAKANKVQGLISALEGVKGIEYVEKVPRAVTHATPNDFTLLSTAAARHLKQINAQNAWNYFNGNSNITVAIIDNAVLWTHVDIVANTYTNTGEIANNSIDDDGNGYVDDRNGFNVADWDNNANPTNPNMTHGTHCAGIAGARTDNNTGVASIGWNVKIIPVQCEADGGSTTSVTYGYDGILYASKAKAKVISCSWGSGTSALSEQAVINYAWNRGSIVIASAGNLGSSSAPFPAGYNNVYAVAGVDTSNYKIGFSNYGPWVDISAPGWDILSTLAYTGTPLYGYLSGTSMSAPMVAGLAGLMLSKSPGMTRQDVLNCISSTAANIYSLSPNSTFTGSLGAGMIDAAAAMSCAATYSALPPLADFSAFMRNTCPNTPVQFMDSSLYLPTAWSWTFQGGSPATSTLQNPVVSWANAGTYSVALQASNTNGSNTKTKTAYITVAGPIALPFTEGFQQSTFLPAGWTAKNIGNDNMYWERVTGVGAYATSTACVRFDNYNNPVEGERDEMLSPKFTFTSVATASLQFDVAYARYDADFSDTLQVKLSTDCGTTWTSIYLKGGTTLATKTDDTNFFVPTSTQWRTESINITTLTAQQGNVMFSFINRGHFGQPIYIDNINLAFPTPTLTVTHPTAVCAGATLNFGNTSSSVGSYSWSFPGGTPASATSSAPAVSYASSGTKTITISALNGTSTASITRTVNVIAMPATAVNSPSTCSGNSVVLQASGATTYSWSTTAVTSSISVTPNATTQYTVTGTNGNLCSVNATATVSVVATPTLSVPHQTVCPGGTATLTASGAGGYLWNTMATTNSIVVTPSATTIYTVVGNNGPCVSTETVMLTLGPPLPVQITASSNSVCVAQSITLTATGASNFVWGNNSTGSFITDQPTITSVYTVTGSVNSCTGMATATITVDQTPTLVLNTSPGAGPFCSNQPLIIQASGAQNFQWTNGPSGAMYIVTPAQQGPLSVTVTGSNGGCSVSTSTILTIGPDTMQVIISPSVVTVCAGQQVTLTASGMNTYTWSGNQAINPYIFTAISSGPVAVQGSAGNCPGYGEVAITVNSLPGSTLSSSNTACAGSCNGIVSAQTSGGTGPYSYQVTPGNCNTMPCTQLCAGQYTVTTTDANQCSGVSIVIVGSSAPLTVTNTTSPNSCASCNNGSASVMAGGGQPPYTYAWSNGSTGPSIVGAAPGCYTVTATDAASCTIVTVVCIQDVTGQNELNEDAFVIYPNPAKTTLVTDLPPGDFDIEIYNNLAQLVYRSGSVAGKLSIPAESYARGAYLVVFKGEERNFHKKLLLE